MYIDYFALNSRRTTSAFSSEYMHKHVDRHQLIYPKNSIGSFAIDDSVYPYQPDHLYYAPAGMLHECLNEIGTDYDIIYFRTSDPNLLDSLKSFPYMLRLRYPSFVRFLFRQMHLLKISNNPLSRFHRLSYFMMLLTLETDKLISFPLFNEEPANPHGDHIKLQNNFENLLGFISLYLNDMSIERMIHYSGYQKTHLYRLFRKHLNTTPHKYVNNLRVERAKELLVSLNVNISDISYEAGFDSPDTFARVFKNKTGFSPSDYREKYKKTTMDV